MISRSPMLQAFFFDSHDRLFVSICYKIVSRICREWNLLQTGPKGKIVRPMLCMSAGTFVLSHLLPMTSPCSKLV